MKKLLEDLLFTGLGSLVVTKEKVDELIETMVNNGEVTRKEGKEILKRFRERTENETSKITNKISDNLRKKLKEAGFVTKDELENLKSQLNMFEKELKELKESINESENNSEIVGNN